MGFTCELTVLYSFTYRAELDSGLIEYEKDTVLLGRYDGAVSHNPEEVQAWRWLDLPSVLAGVEEKPEEYTVWFRAAVARVAEAILKEEIQKKDSLCAHHE